MKPLKWMGRRRKAKGEWIPTSWQLKRRRARATSGKIILCLVRGFKAGELRWQEVLLPHPHRVRGNTQAGRRCSCTTFGTCGSERHFSACVIPSAAACLRLPDVTSLGPGSGSNGVRVGPVTVRGRAWATALSRSCVMRSTAFPSIIDRLAESDSLSYPLCLRLLTCFALVAYSVARRYACMTTLAPSFSAPAPRSSAPRADLLGTLRIWAAHQLSSQAVNAQHMIEATSTAGKWD